MSMMWDPISSSFPAFYHLPIFYVLFSSYIYIFYLAKYVGSYCSIVVWSQRFFRRDQINILKTITIKCLWTLESTEIYLNLFNRTDPISPCHIHILVLYKRQFEARSHTNISINKFVREILFSMVFTMSNTLIINPCFNIDP